MFNKEKMNQERERAMRLYDISHDATDEEIRMQVYKYLHLPTYEEFKSALYKHIKEVGIKDTKEDVIDVFDPDSYVWEDTCYFFGVVYTDVEDWFFSVVSNFNMLYAFDDDEMNDIHSVSDNMPTELDDRNPLIIFDSYIDRMEKEDLQELKDLIMSLAQDEE